MQQQFSKFLPQSFQQAPRHTHQDNDVKKLIFNETYATPTVKDMLIILPYFNPCNSVRILQNLLIVRNKLEQANIPFLIIHCLFPCNVALEKESITYTTVHSNSYAFLKENLANIAITKNLTNYNKFFIHDGDVIFKERDWYNQTSACLDNHDIIQPYSTFKTMDANFIDVLTQGYSLFSMLSKDKPSKIQIGHYGYLIAFTKQFWLNYGYADEALLGGGDILTCSLVLQTQFFVDSQNKAYIEYLYNIHLKSNSPKVGYVPCTIYHLYHNVIQNRQYWTRYMILDKYIGINKMFHNIQEMIKKNDDGVYEWNSIIREEINKDVLKYFKMRQDDEVL